MPDVPTNKRTKRVDELVAWLVGDSKPYPTLDPVQSRFHDGVERRMPKGDRGRIVFVKSEPAVELEPGDAT